jgi:uncharacterized protein involved in outer membrane biogenesis
MKALKVVGILLVLAALILGGGLWYLSRYVRSPQFQATVRAAAEKSLGANVTIREMNVSLREGVTLRGIVMANPPGFAGDLLTADAFVLRYRLWPLLQKKIAIQKLAIEQPVLTLVRDASGTFNYEKLGTPKTAAPAGGGREPAPGGPALDVDLSAIVIRDGELSVVNDTGKRLVKLAGLGLETSVALRGQAMTGRGAARIEEINVANAILVRQVKAPVTIGAEIELAPVRGQWAGGSVDGTLTMRTTGGFRYRLDLTARDANVATLLREMGTQPSLTGQLQLTAKLEGTGGLATITGGGRAEVVNGQLTGVALLNLLGTLLQVPELQNLQFRECVLEYTLTNHVMQTPVIRLTAPLVQMTGRGAMELQNYTLQHTFTLALAESLLAQAPNEIRRAFSRRDDGFLTIEFNVTGPYDAPKTDLSQRLLKGAGQQLLDKGLKKLFN